MDIFETIWASLTAHIDTAYMIFFMCIAYIGKNWLHGALQYITNRNLNKRLIIFIIGTIVAIPFWFWFGSDKMKLLVTWSFGCAFHDYIVMAIVKIIRRVLGLGKEDPS